MQGARPACAQVYTGMLYTFEHRNISASVLADELTGANVSAILGVLQASTGNMRLYQQCYTA